ASRERIRRRGKTVDAHASESGMPQSRHHCGGIDTESPRSLPGREPSGLGLDCSVTTGPQISSSSRKISGSAVINSPRLKGKKSFVPKYDSVISAKNSLSSVKP